MKKTSVQSAQRSSRRIASVATASYGSANASPLLLLVVPVLFLLSACGSEGGGASGVAGFGDAQSGESASVTNTVAKPSDMAVGDIYQAIYSAGEKGTIDMVGVDSDAEFVMAVANVGSTRGTSSIQISGSLSDTAATPIQTKSAGDNEWNWTAGEAFHAQLRNLELSLADLPPAALGSIGAKAAATGSVPRVGDQERFRVLTSISSLSSYKDVTGEVRCVGERVLWYMDIEVLGSGSVLSDTEIQQLCTDFDATTQREYALLGEPSDVNADGRVAVLMTPQVNRLGAAGGGTVTGYFLATDLHPRSTTSNPTSNMREILYVLVPDATGKYGFRVSKDLALSNLLPAVLPHELQHAISYNQHVFEQGGAPEEAWLNEGLAHLMEDVLGAGRENPSRYELYLQRAGSYSIASPASPGLAERGGTFLFLRYLYEQHGASDDFLRAMLQTDLTGMANLEAAYGSSEAQFDQFGEFMLRWSAALVLNDTGLTSDARYAYESRQWDNQQDLHSGVCTRCEVEDGRGTVLEGVQPVAFGSHSAVQLAGGAVQFFVVSGSHQTVSLSSADASQYGVALVRVR